MTWIWCVVVGGLKWTMAHSHRIWAHPNQTASWFIIHFLFFGAAPSADTRYALDIFPALPYLCPLFPHTAHNFNLFLTCHNMLFQPLSLWKGRKGPGSKALLWVRQKISDILAPGPHAIIQIFSALVLHWELQNLKSRFSRNQLQRQQSPQKHSNWFETTTRLPLCFMGPRLCF